MCIKLLTPSLSYIIKHKMAFQISNLLIYPACFSTEYGEQVLIFILFFFPSTWVFKFLMSTLGTDARQVLTTEMRLVK